MSMYVLNGYRWFCERIVHWSAVVIMNRLFRFQSTLVSIDKSLNSFINRAGRQSQGWAPFLASSERLLSTTSWLQNGEEISKRVNTQQNTKFLKHFNASAFIMWNNLICICESLDVFVNGRSCFGGQCRSILQEWQLSSDVAFAERFHSSFMD